MSADYFLIDLMRYSLIADITLYSDLSSVKNPAFPVDVEAFHGVLSLNDGSTVQSTADTFEEMIEILHRNFRIHINNDRD